MQLSFLSSTPLSILPTRHGGRRVHINACSINNVRMCSSSSSEQQEQPSKPSSSKPKSQSVSQNALDTTSSADAAPKRKRGRPKGSKNRRKYMGGMLPGDAPVGNNVQSSSSFASFTNSQLKNSTGNDDEAMNQVQLMSMTLRSKRGRPRGSGRGISRSSTSPSLSNTTPFPPTRPIPPTPTRPGPTSEPDSPSSVHSETFRREFTSLLPALARDAAKTAAVAAAAARKANATNSNSSNTEDKETALQEMIEIAARRRAELESTYRNPEWYSHLRPFAMRNSARTMCENCAGEGMHDCRYCSGEGFIRMSEEDSAKEVIEFMGAKIAAPRKVDGVADTYHCPLCGGLCMERCLECMGKGFFEDPNVKFAASKVVAEPAWKVFDMNEFIEEHKDRIEIYDDGVVVLRAKPRKKRAKNGNSTGTIRANAGKEEKAKDLAQKRGRGRPRKGQGMDDLYPLPDVPLSPPAVRLPQIHRTVGKTTDFVNTTNYKVGRTLRQMQEDGDLENANKP